jgi:hypothetical protein
LPTAAVRLRGLIREIDLHGRKLGCSEFAKSGGA